MKKLLKFLGFVLLLLIVAVLARTLRIPSKQIAPLSRSARPVRGIPSMRICNDHVGGRERSDRIRGRQS
jgi:hypothetical protein